MTEAEWKACTDPTPMLEFLHGKASDRKLRLFACAYARMGSWLGAFSKVCGDHFYNGWGQQKPAIDVDAAQGPNSAPAAAIGTGQKPAIDVDAAQAALLALRLTPGGGLTFRGCPPFGDLGEQEVAVAERYADGLAGGPEFEGHRAPVGRRLHRAAQGAGYCGPSAFGGVEQWAVLTAALAPTGPDAARGAVESVKHYFVSVADSGKRRGMNPAFREPVRRQTLALQADLLREIFGPLPFHPVAIDPSVSAWNNGAVRKMAQAIYEDRAFDRLPLLADALEDAGCTDAAILGHCRGPGEHIRGCWAVDLLLKT